MGYRMSLMQNYYTNGVNPVYLAEQQDVGITRPWDMTPRIPEQLQSEGDRYSDTSSQSKAGKKSKKRAEWTTEQSGFLLQLWADNYEYINSAHSRKAWKKVLEKTNTKFINEPRSILGAGFESQDSTGVEGNVDMDIEKTIAIPGSSSTPKTFQVISQTLVEDQDSAADDDNNNNDDNNAVTEPQLDHFRERGEWKKGKSKKKTAKELEAEKTNALMEEMSSQGRELVAAVKSMEENAQLQTIAMQDMARTLSIAYAGEGRKRLNTKQSPSPRKKRQRKRAEPEDSDSF
eukprot:gene7620-8460_t